MAWLDTLKKALGVAGVETPKVQDVKIGRAHV